MIPAGVLKTPFFGLPKRRGRGLPRIWEETVAIHFIYGDLPPRGQRDDFDMYHTAEIFLNSEKKWIRSGNKWLLRYQPPCFLNLCTSTPVNHRRWTKLYDILTLYDANIPELNSKSLLHKTNLLHQLIFIPMPLFPHPSSEP